MSERALSRTSCNVATRFALATALTICSSLAVLALPQLSVSQKGRTFRPPDVHIERGGSVEVVNDDADLLHHVYIDSDQFKFDSGDQKPGSRTSITFPATGTFDVLCAIHPKMKLTVHVK